MLRTPRTVDAIIKPLQKALAGLNTVATYQDTLAEEATKRLSVAESVFAETKATEDANTTAAAAEAGRARKLAAKFDNLLN